MQVGIVGASGYTGAELLRLCAQHPEMDVVLTGAESQAGQSVSNLYPSLSLAYPDAVFERLSAADLNGLDVVFLGLPHGEAQKLVPDLVGHVGLVVDLSADFRLKDPLSYPEWYGHEHLAPHLLDQAAYGLPELFRSDLAGANLVASAGCYPTASALAIAPLIRAGVAEPTGVIVDAASGVSGAGRTLRHSSHFNTVDEDFTAYGLLDHRHTPEIEQATGAQVLFTPHLAPMNRGILATCYLRPRSDDLTTDDVMSVLSDAYTQDRFVVVGKTPPSTKATLGSNCVFLTARVDRRTGWILAIAAIDNLVKGASGQAIQCANIATGLEEHLGLPQVGLYP